jgi:hypothetical protein
VQAKIIDAEVLLFLMLKGGVDKRTRDAMGTSIARSLSRALGVAQRPALTPEETEVVQRLARTGFAPVKPMFSPAELDDIDRYFADKPMEFTNGEMGATGVKGLLADHPAGLRFGHWDQDVISGCPAFCRAAYDPELLRIAEAYLGAPPTITILTAWWSFPAGEAVRGGMQNYHHDRDDFRSLKVFTYLTDTTLSTGPHEFVEETHSIDALEALMIRQRWNSAEAYRDFMGWMEVHRKDDGEVARRFPKENIRTVTGARGTTFFEDTRGLHRGLPPTEGPRLAFEFCYALLPKHNSQYTPIARPCSPAAVSPVADYATRLLYNT